MWIFRFTYCLFQGHAFVDINNTHKAYQYCLHCGKVQEPEAFLKCQHSHSANA
jgi:hypothetical protein